MITDIEGKMPSITVLATNAFLNAVKNKMPNITDLVKNIDYDAKISDIETNYFYASDYNKFTGKILNANIKEKGLLINLLFMGL